MACTMSGMAAINAMVSVVHAIGHVVGGRHGLQHGVSHTILLAPAMRLLLPAIGDDQTLLLDALDGTRQGSAEADGAEAAKLMSAFISRLPLRQSLRELGTPEGELTEIARLTMSDYMMANLPRPMAEAEVLALLRSAW
jgi:alcohol dehydrogenase class IV